MSAYLGGKSNAGYDGGFTVYLGAAVTVVMVRLRARELAYDAEALAVFPD